MKSFVEKVAKMRSLQKEYFRFRDKEILCACKMAEKEIDSLCASYLGLGDKPIEDNNYPKMF